MKITVLEILMGKLSKRLVLHLVLSLIVVFVLHITGVPVNIDCHLFFGDIYLNKINLIDFSYI